MAALAYDERAIQLDPNFAEACRSVAEDYGNLEQLERASEYLSKAYELRKHTSERERLLVTADPSCG